MEDTFKYIRVYNHYVEVCKQNHHRPSSYPEYKQELLNGLFNIDEIIMAVGL